MSIQFQFQIPLAQKVLKSIEFGNKPVCAAVTTSAGKSAITVRVLEGYFKNGAERTAVFIGSNQTVLAQQFFDVLTNDCPVPFTFSFSMLNESHDSQLKIGLPQQLINRPRKVGLLILDEAQTLWPLVDKNPNSMMSKILKLCQPEAVLLLTGSPSFFTSRKNQYDIHYLSYEDIPNQPVRVFSKVAMDLVPVADRDNIEECLRTFFRSAKQKRDDLSQLAVVARNVHEAEKVKTALERQYGLRCLISTSKHDGDSVNLVEFKKGRYRCIVTVNRIIAGWSYNDLTCILDLAASKNKNRGFQLFSRLLRVKDDSTTKSYHRICLRQHQQREACFLHKMKSLLSRETYVNYTEPMSKDDGLLKAA